MFNSLLKEGHSEPVVQHGFGVSPKDGDGTASLGKLGQCPAILTMKKCFLMIRHNFPYFHLCPLLLVLALGATEKSLALSALHPPFRQGDEIPPEPPTLMRSHLRLFFLCFMPFYWWHSLTLTLGRIVQKVFKHS